VGIGISALEAGDDFCGAGLQGWSGFTGHKIWGICSHRWHRFHRIKNDYGKGVSRCWLRDWRKFVLGRGVRTYLSVRVRLFLTCRMCLISKSLRDAGFEMQDASCKMQDGFRGLFPALLAAIALFLILFISENCMNLSMGGWSKAVQPPLVKK
jgi:hypothetical protein